MAAVYPTLTLTLTLTFTLSLISFRSLSLPLPLRMAHSHYEWLNSSACAVRDPHAAAVHTALAPVPPYQFNCVAPPDGTTDFVALICKCHRSIKPALPSALCMCALMTLPATLELKLSLLDSRCFSQTPPATQSAIRAGLPEMRTMGRTRTRRVWRRVRRWSKGASSRRRRTIRFSPEMGIAGPHTLTATLSLTLSRGKELRTAQHCTLGQMALWLPVA